MKLYYTEASPPCRTIILLANLLNIKLELILTSPKKGETVTASFLQMNPQHVVPTLIDDDGYILWESRVIAKYLVEKYAKSDDLYPSTLYTRLEIDKILDFDLGTIFRRSSEHFIAVLFTGKYDPARKPKLDDALNVLNEILMRNNSNFVVGKKLTIADISLIATVSSLEVTGYDFSKFPNIISWLSNIKNAIPDYETIGMKGELAFKDMVDACLK
ncbi:glutathione S-transferase 1-like [Planococcus citri]|uniref:glutathione S-transferase 1-like n=1 Tax=Planococcus citri TaxID=170843 RepID=UPI0031F9BC99